MTNKLKARGIALISLLAVFGSACDGNNEVDFKQHASSTVGPAAFDGVLRTEQAGFLLADFGSVQLRIPEAKKPTSSHRDVLSWHLWWPGIDLVLADPSRGTKEWRLSHEVFLNVVRRSRAAQNAYDDGHVYLVKLLRLNGPYRSESLQLAEFRYPTEPAVGAIYLSESAINIAPSDQLKPPYVRCDRFSGSGQMDGRRRCKSHGVLSADVAYEYSFSEALWPEWRQLDEAVRAFVLSMKLNTN